MKKQKIIVIVGPTATGKSSLAVKLAKKFNGEIVSADSRQVYTGLNIGTGKITKREMGGIHHHLIDVSSPKKVFSAADFKALTDKVIADISRTGKVPIVCGGTGFYIDTLIGKIALPEVRPNFKLRKKLGSVSTDRLFKKLLAIDPVRAKNIDRHNRVRLIRAIEIATSLGRVPTSKSVSRFDCLFIGLRTRSKTLQDKISKRMYTRLKKGMIAEAKKLYRSGVSWKRMNELGLEYRYLSKYLRGKITRVDMEGKLEQEIFQYAKRQMQWFKRNKKIRWFDVEDGIPGQKIDMVVKKFLSR